METLTVEEVSKILGIPYSSVCSLMRRGIIPAKKLGRHWRVAKSVFDRWLNSEPEEYRVLGNKVRAVRRESHA